MGPSDVKLLDDVCLHVPDVLDEVIDVGNRMDSEVVLTDEVVLADEVAFEDEVGLTHEVVAFVGFLAGALASLKSAWSHCLARQVLVKIT